MIVTYPACIPKMSVTVWNGGSHFKEDDLVHMYKTILHALHALNLLVVCMHTPPIYVCTCIPLVTRAKELIYCTTDTRWPCDAFKKGYVCQLTSSIMYK